MKKIKDPSAKKQTWFMKGKRNVKKILLLLMIVALFSTAFIFYSIDKTRNYISYYEVTKAIDSFGYHFISSEEKEALDSCKYIYSYLDTANNKHLTSDNQLAKRLSFNSYLIAIRRCVGQSESNSSELFMSLWTHAQNEIMDDLTNAGYDLEDLEYALIFELDEDKYEEEDYYQYDYEDGYTFEEKELPGDLYIQYHPYALDHSNVEIEDQISSFFHPGYNY